MNNAVLSFVDDDKCGAILEALRERDGKSPELGLRAFSWSVDQ